ncbi:hypothetical protein [Nocardia aobensis]|uniref:hypothetical protein n=1 Tax=Nocardia aobensis TaxID=257277 RepID=UPI0012F62285|nr:hypothetical protein [Nocardia aobensis]
MDSANPVALADMTPENRQVSYETGLDRYFQALPHLAIWGHAVMNQRDRILQSAADSVNGDDENFSLVESFHRSADSVFFVYALHQLRATIVLIAKSLPDERVSEAIGRSVQSFDAQLPWLRSARNIFAHFDEYIQGAGRMQKATPGAALNFVHNTHLGRERGNLTARDYILSVTIIPGGPAIEVGVNESARAARGLVVEVEGICREFLASESVTKTRRFPGESQDR